MLKCFSKLVVLHHAPAQVSEEEYRAAMGMGLEDLKRAVYDKLGSAEAAMEAMDKDGDGVISEDEFVERTRATHPGGSG